MKVETVPSGLIALFPRRIEPLSGWVVIQVGFRPESEVPRTVRLLDDGLNKTLVMTELYAPTRRVNVFEVTILARVEEAETRPMPSELS